VSETAPSWWEEHLTEEQRAVAEWRLAEARRVGLPHEAACEFASSDADLATLRRLVEQGADPLTALDIVS
jgi:hypothetical protein